MNIFCAEFVFGESLSLEEQDGKFYAIGTNGSMELNTSDQYAFVSSMPTACASISVATIEEFIGNGRFLTSDGISRHIKGNCYIGKLF